MDFGIIDVVHHLDQSLGVPLYEPFEAARYVMGDTRRYAKRMTLIDMVPLGRLTSTGFALVNPGKSCISRRPLTSLSSVR